MPNPFSSRNGGLSAPASRLAPITPDDDNDLPGGVCRALLVASAGTVNMTDASGGEHEGVPLQQGFNPIGARRIRTGGTATGLWALY